MRSLSAVLGAIFVCGMAWAQPPEIVEPEDQIQLGIGEARTLKFHEPFTRAGTVTENIAQILPQSDRTLTVSGMASGQTLMFVHDEKGNLIYSATISVTPSTGHLVRLYGGTRDKDTAMRGLDYAGYYCTELTCSRADGDKPMPSGQATTITRPIPNGGTLTTTTPN